MVIRSHNTKKTTSLTVTVAELGGVFFCLFFCFPQGPIHALAFSPSGKFLASGATDGRVLLWDIGHGLMIGELKGHTDTIYALKFSRDGEILASGGWLAQSNKPF